MLFDWELDVTFKRREVAKRPKYILLRANVLRNNHKDSIRKILTNFTM